MNDHDFLLAFERGDMHQLHGFPHEAHVRMAWIYLYHHDWEDGSRKIRDGIQHLAKVNGATRKYHETITLFWAHVVNAHIALAPELDSFEAFIAQYPRLLDTDLIKHHYSADLLRSEAARQTWAEPDLVPLVIPG